MAAIYILYKFRNGVAPIVIAFLLAYILNPFVNWINKRLHIPRFIAILLVYILLLALIVVFFMLITPLLVHQLRIVNWDITFFMADVGKFLSKDIKVGEYLINGEMITTYIINTLQSITEPLINQTLDIATGILSSLVWLIVIFFVSIYMMLDSGSIVNWLERLIPPGYEEDYFRIKH